MDYDKPEHISWLNNDPTKEDELLYQEAMDILEVIDNTTPDWVDETSRLRQIINRLERRN